MPLCNERLRRSGSFANDHYDACSSCQAHRTAWTTVPLATPGVRRRGSTSRSQGRPCLRASTKRLADRGHKAEADCRCYMLARAKIVSQTTSMFASRAGSGPRRTFLALPLDCIAKRRAAPASDRNVDAVIARINKALGGTRRFRLIRAVRGEGYVLAAPTEYEWPHIFEDLRHRKRLSELVRGVNRLLNEPAHRELAQSALKRIRLTAVLRRR